MPIVELQQLLLSYVAFEAVKCETWSLVRITSPVGRLQVQIWAINVFLEDDSDLCYRIINY